jgi:hypothetical protein
VGFSPFDLLWIPTQFPVFLALLLAEVKNLV